MRIRFVTIGALAVLLRSWSGDAVGWVTLVAAVVTYLGTLAAGWGPRATAEGQFLILLAVVTLMVGSTDLSSIELALAFVAGGMLATAVSLLGSRWTGDDAEPGDGEGGAAQATGRPLVEKLDAHSIAQVARSQIGAFGRARALAVGVATASGYRLFEEHPVWAMLTVVLDRLAARGYHAARHRHRTGSRPDRPLRLVRRRASGTITAIRTVTDDRRPADPIPYGPPMRNHRSFPLRGLALTLVIVVIGLVGCGSDDSDDAIGPTTTAGTADTAAADQGEPGLPPEDAVDLTGQAEVTVAVGDNKYTERTIVVSPGTDVTWVNEGLNRHNVIASVPDSFEDIETEDLDDGGSAVRTFDAAGEYAYFCSIHGSVNAGQRGWVYVADESA